MHEMIVETIIDVSAVQVRTYYLPQTPSLTFRFDLLYLHININNVFTYLQIPKVSGRLHRHWTLR